MNHWLSISLPTDHILTVGVRRYEDKGSAECLARLIKKAEFLLGTELTYGTTDDCIFIVERKTDRYARIQHKYFNGERFDSRPKAIMEIGLDFEHVCLLMEPYEKAVMTEMKTTLEAVMKCEPLMTNKWFLGFVMKSRGVFFPRPKPLDFEKMARHESWSEKKARNFLETTVAPIVESYLAQRKLRILMVSVYRKTNEDTAVIKWIVKDYYPDIRVELHNFSSPVKGIWVTNSHNMLYCSIFSGVKDFHKNLNFLKIWKDVRLSML